MRSIKFGDLRPGDLIGLQRSTGPIYLIEPRLVIAVTPPLVNPRDVVDITYLNERELVTSSRMRASTILLFARGNDEP